MVLKFGVSRILCRTTSRCWVSTQRKMSYTGPNRSIVQNFDYFLILDFEATCDDRRDMVPQEIIEFPVLKLNAKTWQVDATFHQYVQPRVHRQLTPFCTQLTGIIQEMVDGQPHLEQVLQMFDVWLDQQQLDKLGQRWSFVTCGDWDLNSMLPRQCQYFNIATPCYFHRWINVKKAFSAMTGVWPKGMMNMLEFLSITHKGRHHSGIDDSRNIAEIVKALAARQILFRITKSNISYGFG